MAQTEFIQPAGLASPAAYTQMVTVSGGKLIILSGQVAYDADAKLVGEGDLGAQTMQVCKNIQTALAAAGATFDDVVKWTTYVVDYKPEYRETIGAVRSQFVSAEHPPASTLIGVQALALDGLLIEIEAIAVVE